MNDTRVRNLRRTRHDRVVAGVCGGLGRFYGIDPVWFRLMFFLLLIPGGLPGFVPYMVMWLIIPRE